MLKPIGHRLRWREALQLLRHAELGYVLSLGALAAGLYVFIEVAEEVTEGGTHSVDRALLYALRNPSDLSDPLGPPWLEEMVCDWSALGGRALLSLLSIAVITHLLLAKRPRAAGLVAISVIGASLLSLGLKRSFQRPRPDLVPRLLHVSSSSFPSGHSLLSAAVYLTLGALLARTQPNRLLKIHILSWASLLTLLVGVSRVYVGVHWPSDVCAGWAAGAAWAALCWLVAHALQRRGLLDA
ncbi:MAG: hypothetical protein RL033_5568 [Pseudomonadota bacterium]|jgi:undecaprenyl-diphosphatase